MIFTTLKIRVAYNALRIRIDDEWKIAFRCKYEHFEYLVMFFELTNASANFSSYIYLTLCEYLNIFCIFCIFCFHNILIYWDDKYFYENHVQLIFEKLRKLKLFVSLKKCFFELNEIDHLKYLLNTIKI